MSHFNVAVITPEEPTAKMLGELLIPYCEDTEYVPKEYWEFSEVEDIEDYKNFFNDSNNTTNINGVDTPFNKAYTSFREYMEKCEGCSYNKKTKTFGYWCNPNAKWDWYVVGGRWKNMLPTKDHSKVDTCQIKDVDWDVDKKNVPKYKREWEILVEGDKPQNEYEELLIKERPFYHKPEWLKNQYGSKDGYIYYMSTIVPFATLFEGNWYEEGAMGWFGMSHSEEGQKDSFREKFSEIITKYPNYWITIVDCHI